MFSSRALYIGAGLDMRPIHFLNDIDTFIYVDSRPYSPYGRFVDIDKNGINRTYDTNFITNLDATMKIHNMKLCVIKDNKRVYSNGKKTVFYYVNNSVPEDIPTIEYELLNIDYLIVAGHDPHYEILNHISEPVHFIGMDETNYNADDTYDGVELTYKLNNNEYRDKFIDFSYMYFDRYFKMEKKTFKTWDAFIDNYSLLYM